VGTTFKKTEVALTALVGLVVLGDRISMAGFAAILLGLVGVIILSDMPALEGRMLRRIGNRAAGLGLASGLLFALSGVGYRGATLEIASADPLLRASVTLTLVALVQVLGMSAWLAWREAGQIARVGAAWRTGVWMGIAGMASSICWFTAFTQQNAAYVFAVGQVEVIFSLAASVFFFGERITGREALGMALVTLSVLGVGLFH
jgi:drug/metabolite transporter (DMT)-like permease